MELFGLETDRALALRRVSTVLDHPIRDIARDVVTTVVVPEARPPKKQGV